MFDRHLITSTLDALSGLAPISIIAWLSMGWILPGGGWTLAFVWAPALAWVDHRLQPELDDAL